MIEPRPHPESTPDEPWVWWDGRLRRSSEAKVSVLDSGYLYGDGIYETLRAYEGVPFALDRHLARCRASAAGVDLPCPPTAELARAIRDVIAANAWADAVVRLTLTRGVLSRRFDLGSAGAPSLLVSANPLDPAADETRRRGVRVIYSQFGRWSEYGLAGIKSTNYQISLLARHEARVAGAAEVLLPNESGDLVEGAASNLFAVETHGERSRLVTPALGAGVLGGITREIVLELAAAADLPVEEASLSRARLEAAAEVFLTGTTIQLAPIVRIGETTVGAGAPGPVTLDLLAAYLSRVNEDVRAGASADDR